MPLPSTSAAQTFWIEGSRKGILFNTGAYATTATGSTLQVQSVLNKAGLHDAVIQNTSSAQPTWNGGSLSGTYLWQNKPGVNPVTGSTVANVAGSAALIFNGSTQFLEYDSIASYYSNDAPVAIVAVVSAAGNGTIAGFGVGTGSDQLSLAYAGAATFIFTEVNTAGTHTYTASATVAENTTHVITGIRTGGNLSIRVDGALIQTTPIAVTGTDTYAKFCIGAVNTSSVGNFFNGQIGEVAVYSGTPVDILSVETSLLVKFGIIRSPTSGTNNGF